MGVSQSDIYQMLAYARAYDAKRVVLLYPWHREMDKPGLNRRWTVTGSDCRLDIATVNVGCPHRVEDTLRRIIESAADLSVRLRQHPTTRVTLLRIDSGSATSRTSGCHAAASGCAFRYPIATLAKLGRAPLRSASR